MSHPGQESKALLLLNEADVLMREELTEINKINGSIEEKKQEIAEEKANKKQKINELKKEIEVKKRQIEHIQKLTSASRDARKMYGDITPGDITHGDVVLQYQNFFKDVLRNMPKTIDGDKYKLWVICNNIMEESFDHIRDRIVDKMHTCLNETLTKEHETLTEEEYDVQRAFKMLLDEMVKKDELEPIIDEIKKLEDMEGHKEEIDFVKEMMALLKPDDYLHFIKEGKPRYRNPTNIILPQ